MKTLDVPNVLQVQFCVEYHISLNCNLFPKQNINSHRAINHEYLFDYLFQHFLRLFLSLFIVRNCDPTLKSHFGQESLEDFQAFRGFWKARNSCLESVSNTHFWWQSHTFSYLKLTLVFWFFVHNQFKISDVALSLYSWSQCCHIFLAKNLHFAFWKSAKSATQKFGIFCLLLHFYVTIVFQNQINFLKFLKKYVLKTICFLSRISILVSK